MTARVFIVGAGPGDPSLITVRGRECLARADVVIYDRRVDARLLAAARPEAERIDVGAAAPRPLDQEAISYLVAEKAREGRVVVRLKWGDPFVFDSGGKEAIFLHEQRIPFEVVPGIPLAFGGAAYAGVPVTYPEAGDAVILLRGNEAETDAPAHVNWGHVAALRGTLLCYAGARQIPAIAHALVSHGRSPSEAAAIVYDPTLPSQQTVDGALGSISGSALADRAGLLVVGAVAGLRQYLRWFDQRPLFGRRVVVTRSSDQAGDLVGLLEDAGARTILLPTIRILPADPGELEAICRRAESFDWIVFTSANGVDHFMRRFLAVRDVRDLKGVRICTVGPATAAALERFGIRVDLTPEEHRAESVVTGLCARGDLSGQRVLLPRGDLAREILGEELRRSGAEVVEVAAYRTVPAGEQEAQHVYGLLLERRVDAVTFTSASTVRNFVRLLGDEQAVDLLRSAVVAAIGPVTADAASQLGIGVSVMPATYTMPALVDALVSYFAEHPVSTPASP